MGDNCNDCNVAIQHEGLKEEVKALKEDLKNLEKKVAELETSSKVTQEQTKMVFNILNEIKASIKTIADKLDVLEKQPGENWKAMVKTIITVIATAIVTYFIKK